MQRLMVWIDGACEPINPGGTASYGLLVKYGEETILAESAVVGHGQAMSNNVAEYSGLIRFLQWYSENHWNYLETTFIYSDSKMLIEQMNGYWRVKKGLYVPYFFKAKEIIQRVGLKVGFYWIPREKNQEADILSKNALATAGITLRIQKI